VRAPLQNIALTLHMGRFISIHVPLPAACRPRTRPLTLKLIAPPAIARPCSSTGGGQNTWRIVIEAPGSGGLEGASADRL